MNAAAKPEKAKQQGEQDRAFLRPLIFVFMQSLLLFIGSGRIEWVGAWLFTGVCAGGILGSYLFVPKELLSARGRVGEGWKKWDKFLLPWIMLGPILISLVAALDVRFGWTRAFSRKAQFLAALMILLGHALVIWAMRSNRHFEGVVRIQRDRAHRVETSGPYRYVRHPGYVGMITFNACTPLVLGSRAAFLPATLVVLVFLARTALEDRILRHELAGYTEYASRVQYRLVPLLW